MDCSSCATFYRDAPRFRRGWSGRGLSRIMSGTLKAEGAGVSAARNSVPKKPTGPNDSQLRLGVETTLLFCIRMGLALMAFGFFIARLALILQAVAGPHAHHR